MVRRGGLPSGWQDRVQGAGSSAHTAMFPTGVAFVPESVLREAVEAPAGASFHGVPLHDSVRQMLRQHKHVPALLPPRRGSNVVTLFHGTTPERVDDLKRLGFLRPKCRNLERCKRNDCQCQMLGFGVYLAERPKAMEFALKRAVFDATRGAAVGALLEVEADLGHMKTARPDPCPHGCRKAYVDHVTAWNLWEGYDTLFVDDHSKPAADVKEWCVADPTRLRIKNITLHDTK